MKINGSGGSGQRMFNIIETSYGFKTYDNNSTVYLIGSYKFPNASCIIDMNYAESNLILCARNIAVLKIQNIGGTGQNMFNIKKVGGVYQTSDPNSTAYLLGSQNYDVDNISQFIYFDGLSFISLEDKSQTRGGITNKIKGTGGTGQNMFAIQLASTKCYESLPNYSYWLGCQLYYNT